MTDGDQKQSGAAGLLSVVVPCFNEAPTIEISSRACWRPITRHGPGGHRRRQRLNRRLPEIVDHIASKSTACNCFVSNPTVKGAALRRDCGCPR